MKNYLHKVLSAVNDSSYAKELAGPHPLVAPFLPLIAAELPALVQDASLAADSALWPVLEFLEVVTRLTHPCTFPTCVCFC